jgi:sodium/potassium-transporting ATPase subunit alpha
MAMHIQGLSKEETLKSLNASDKGLCAEEATQRLHEYGHNEIRAVKGKPLWRKLVAQFTHFLALLLWVAAGLSFLSEYLHPGEGMLSLGIAIVVVIIINALFTFIQEYRAEKAVEALKKLLPFNVKVTRGGILTEVPSRDVCPGDLIILSEGDKVPADARLIAANRLAVNNAPLTGEAESKPMTDQPFDGDFMESPNIVFAGTLVVSGSGRAVVFATGMATEFGKIAHLTSGVEQGLSSLQKEIIAVTRVIAIIAITTGIFFFGVGTFTGRGFWHNLLFAIGITIANVPEGLLPTVTLALAMGSQRMVRKKALIKTLTSVETLGSVTVICTDKTGTLTRNIMEVIEVWMDGPDTEARLMKAAWCCTNAVYEEGSYKGDPTETALLRKAREAYGDLSAERVSDIPFDSVRKRMTTVNRINGASFVFTKGAVETVLPLCSRLLSGGAEKPIDDSSRASLLRAYQALMDRGLRVIAFAYKKEDVAGKEEALVECNLVFAGLMGLEDPPRPEVREALGKCREAGIRVIMITGDAGRTAVAIARQIGLAGENPRVIEGPELNGLSDDELKKALAGDIVFARMTPDHKMRVVSVLKDEGERVAVTGDGVNDAPALKKADIGIAMGLSGTDVAKEAADMVLLDDNFATIVNAVEEGRAIFENIKKFITYIFAHGTPEALPYIMFALFRIPLPLTVMQILAIDLGTETIPALALGVEPPESSSMKQPPRRAGGLIDRALLFRGYIFLGLISAVSVLFVYFFVLYRGGWQWGVVLPQGHPLERQASSAVFLGIVIMQIGNVFSCRSATQPVLGRGIFSNKLINIGIVVEVLLAAFIIYHPLGNRLFGTEPLEPAVWFILFPLSALLLIADDVRKRYVIRGLHAS